MQETIIETKICTSCQHSFDITDQDILFLDKLAPTIAGTKYDLPIPEMCPLCRFQQRAAFRNRRNLYKRKCDLTGKAIVSMYSPDKPFKVYYNKDFEAKYDAIVCAKNLDLDKSIMEQFRELQLQTPRFHSAVLTDTMENAEFVNGAESVKNSYLTFSIIRSENVFYGEGIYDSSNCIDCYRMYEGELCYECIESSKMYKSLYCNQCTNCSHCAYCYNCENCTNCFGCVNLIGKNYCFFNEQYTKEEYIEKIKTIAYSQDTKKKFDEFKIKFPHRYARLINTENSTGDDLINDKNCINCFGSKAGEYLRNCHFLENAKNCMDVLNFGTNLERGYESVSVGYNAQNIYFCLECYENLSNLFYCDSCAANVKNCFACVGLRNKEYCILNKQYTKEDYEKMIPQIIEKMQADGERGHYFPSSYSPFSYNESHANEHFPISKEKAIAKGFNRMDIDYNIDAPKDLQANPDIIVCEVTGKPFRLIKQELNFYHKLGLPTPTKHPNQRHKERFAQVNPKRLRTRSCNKCSAEIQTSYSPDRPEIVYCQSCYDKEVY